MFVCYRFFFKRVQLLHNLRNRPVFVRFAGVDVAAGRDVEVVLRNLFARDDAAEFFSLRATP